MLTMKDIPYPGIGSPIVEYTLPDDLLLDDSAFSQKPLQVAKKGETVKIMEGYHFGVVSHPVHCLFRY